MDDLIRRSDLRIYTCAPEEQIALIPAVDAVEVVRCRDCKYCQIADPYEAWCYGGLPAQLTRLDEDFCSRGKRREDGDA